MGSVTLRVRSLVWFVTGAVLATSVTLMFVNAWRVDAAPGDDDSTFVPITPCRLADTRPAPNRVGPAAALGPGGTQVFQATGSNGECTLPTDAVGLSLNITALGASELSFLTIWGDGEQPLAASLNPAPGEPPIPNAVTTPLSGTGAFNIYNFVGNVDVVIDVVGYYTRASLQELADRVAALEAAQAGGVDPAVLARLTAVEASVAINTAGVAANAAGVSHLDAAEPFAVASGTDSAQLGAADEVVASVTVTAPESVAGHVVVNSTGMTASNFEGNRVRCSITTGTVLVGGYVQLWESAGYLTGGFAQIAGTRWFILPAGLTRTYNLVCDNGGDDSIASLDDAVLTAIFTPAP